MKRKSAQKDKNIESLIETVGFIKDHMATKDDIADMTTKEDLKKLENRLTTKIEHIDSKLGAFENHEVDKRLQLEVRVTKLEQKVAR